MKKWWAPYRLGIPLLKLMSVQPIQITIGPYRVTMPPCTSHADVVDAVRRISSLDRGGGYLVLPSSYRFEFVRCPTTTDLDQLWPDEAYP